MFQIVGRASNPASQILLERGHPSALVDEMIPATVYHRLPAREQWERTEALLDRIVAELGLRDLPVLLAGLPNSMSSPLLSAVAGCAPDLSEALVRLMRFLGLWERAITLRPVGWHSAQPRVALDSFMSGHGDGLGSQVLRESVLTVLVQYAREVASWPVAPRRVYLTHPPSSTTSALELFFGAEVVHHANEDAVEFDHASLRIPTKHHNDTTSQTLIQQIEKIEELVVAQLESWPVRTRAEVRVRLEVGTPSIQSVARGLGASDRTLRRRLREAGTTYVAILESVRIDRARELLATTERSMTTIAFDLGFAYPTAFSRAFRRHVGETPSAYRDRLKLGTPQQRERAATSSVARLTALGK